MYSFKFRKLGKKRVLLKNVENKQLAEKHLWVFIE